MSSLFVGKNILVLDLETQKSFKEVKGTRANLLEKLKISVVGVYDYLDNSYRTYEEKEIMALEKRLQELDFVVGFNIRRFDLPVLAPYIFLSVQNLPVLDLLEDVEQFRGHRASLDSLVRPTLKAHKSGTGKDALTLFKENRMKELKQYCLDDVRLTKEIYEYGVMHSKVFFTSSWDYQTYEIPVKWKETSDEFFQKASSRQTPFPTSLF